MLRSGRLQGERVLRPQGYVWVIQVPAPSAEASTTRQQVATPEGEQPPASGALAAWSAAVLAPIVAELAASRETIREQAETIGRVTAERDALAQAAQTAHASILERYRVPLAIAAGAVVLALLTVLWRAWVPS